MGQTDYSTSPVAGREGDIAASGPHRIQASVASGAVKIGILAAFTSSGKPGDQVPAVTTALAALAAVVNAIVTTLASSASAATLSGAGLTGAIGALRMSPARRITIILSNNANWDAGTWILKGKDISGKDISEDIVVADAGNATYTSRQFYSYVESLYIPAQSGTGGTMTVGVSADEADYAKGSVGVAFRDNTREPASNDSYADQEDCPMFVGGPVLVKVEAAVSRGMPCFVRTALSGPNVMGQFRGDPAAGFSLFRGAHFESDGSAAGLAVLVLDL